MKKTIIINYPGMGCMGGIEKYIVELSEFMLLKKVRVIWLQEKGAEVAAAFRGVLLESNIERVPVREHGYHWFAHPALEFSSDEDIIMLSFTPLDMGRAIHLLKEYKDYSIRSFYVVPNTTGNAYYLERYFSGRLKKYVFKNMKRILEKWENAGCIYFFSFQQIEPLETNYSIKIKDKNKKVKPPVFSMPELDENKLIERAERKKFKIISVGRFDFPHKGYILGLIRAYGRLKSKYPDLRLCIIGEGKGEDDVKNEIKQLDIKCQDDIELPGAVSPVNVGKYMDYAHLNISVAGAVIDGAKRGVLSIPARNWCEKECEVYGFLPESKNKIVSSDPGKIVDSYIEQVIQMNAEEYIRRSIDSYNAFKQEDNAEPFFFFKVSCESCEIIDQKDVLFFRWMHYVFKFVVYPRIMLDKLKKNSKKK